MQRKAHRSPCLDLPFPSLSTLCDFTLQAADLGVEMPISIRLRGTLQTDGSIDFAVNESYSPAVALGAGHSVSRVTGNLRMRAYPLRGTDTAAVGNVRLVLSGTGWLTAYTDLGGVRIEVDDLALQGGVVQPALASFTNPSRTIICSDRTAKRQSFMVSLGSVARGTGAVVELTGSRSAGIHVPPGFVVRAGQQYALVPARIDPSFVGRVRLTPAARGVSRAL